MPEYTSQDGRNYPIDKRRKYIKDKFKYLDEIISPSDYLANKYNEATLFRNDVIKISNGVDRNKYFPAQKRIGSLSLKNRIIFGSACYLGEHKGIMYLITALNDLPKNESWKLIMAGRGHLEAEINSKIMTYGLQNYVEMTGPIPNEEMPSFYRTLDVYILPSVWPENQPCTILESNACGVPTIGTNIGGSVELIRSKDDCHSGQIINPNSAIEIANSMILYMENREVLKRHSLNAYKKSIDDSLHINALKYLTIFNS